MSNIKYTSREINEFYATNRIKWEQFYKSEQVVIMSLGLSSGSKVLDIGCGCGGLGLALKERFGVTDYTGVDINQDAADSAKRLNSSAKIICGDILEVPAKELRANTFDVVFSLGCIDWNVLFESMLTKAFEFVKDGGFFVSSFRITHEETVNDMSRAYQYINFHGEKTGEKAAYTIINLHELMRILKNLYPSEIRGYGYWGPPSKSAVLPYERLCFAVFAIRKSTRLVREPEINLDLPDDLTSAKP